MTLHWELLGFGMALSMLWTYRSLVETSRLVIMSRQIPFGIGWLKWFIRCTLKNNELPWAVHAADLKLR